MEFKEDKTTISELKALVGQRCQRKQYRGWICVGTIQAIELSDEIYIISNSGVRGGRDIKFPLWQCRLDPMPETDRAAIDREDKKADRLERIEDKKKKLEEAEAKEKKLKDRADLIKRLQGPPEDSEA